MFPYHQVGFEERVRPIIRWRDSSASGLAAWGNATLNERVLDLLADITFAAEEIRDMVAIEHGFPPFEGFDEALARIIAEAEAVMSALATPSESGPAAKP